MCLACVQLHKCVAELAKVSLAAVARVAKCEVARVKLVCAMSDASTRREAHMNKVCLCLCLCEYVCVHVYVCVRVCMCVRLRVAR